MRPSAVCDLRTVGSRVANKAFSTSTPALVRRLRSDDFPALVYPAIATDGMLKRLRSWRLVSRDTFISAISRRNLAILSRIRRRSVSIFVSPGPRPPIPAPPAARPPTWRESESPQPRSLGSKYAICANSTCALPSLLLACWAKISKIRAVRSTTFTFNLSVQIMDLYISKCKSVLSNNATSFKVPNLT